MATNGSEESLEVRELRWSVNNYRSLHTRAVAREKSWKEKFEQRDRITREQQERIEGLLRENEKLRSREAWLVQQFFGRKSEKTRSCVQSPGPEASPEEALCEVESETRRKRGQQPGAKGSGRKRRTNLATEDIFHDIPQAKKHCPKCGKALRPFPWTEDSEEIHWEVRLLRRVHRRARYLPACKCGVLPGIVAAPVPPKLIPKGAFSTEFWTRLLMEKFLFQRPLYRVRQVLALEGLDVSQGTLTGGLQNIGGLLQPLYAGILERNQGAGHWHMDETRWMVFADLEGKKGHRWWLWVSVTEDTCVYLLDPSRSAEVVQNHLGKDVKGILNADRYAAYKTLKNVKIAFCWSHVRRDFIRIRDGYKELYGWGESWVKRINELFEINAKRREVRALPEAFRKLQRALEKGLRSMVLARNRELGSPALHPAQKKALVSLRNHWKGLNIFVKHPEIPMDNNEAERRLRNPIVGRKNYYGSGSIWSGNLSASLFSLLQTLLINEIDPKQFLLAYFQACAEAGGRPPPRAKNWLPWKLSKEKKAQWRYPKQA